jgi:hypothetical protein
MIKFCLRCCAVTAFVWAMLGAEARAATIYVTVTGTTTKFGRFDTTTGLFTGIPTTGVGGTDNLAGLTWNAAAGRFDVVVTSFLDGFLKPITITGSVGPASLAIVKGGDMQGVATTGTAAPLYTFVNGVGTSYQLGTTNRSTGAWTAVTGAYSGFPLESFPQQFGAISYGPTGYLYAAGNTADGNIFGRLDESTGLFTQIGSANAAFNGMALTSDGTTLYGITSEGPAPGIYSVNMITGVPTLLSSVTGFGAEAGVLAAGMAAAPVPEPATAGLVAAAVITGVIASARRAQRIRS